MSKTQSKFGVTIPEPCDCTLNLLNLPDGGLISTNCSEAVTDTIVWEYRSNVLPAIADWDELDWDVLLDAGNNLGYDNGLLNSIIRIKYTENGCVKYSNTINTRVINPYKSYVATISQSLTNAPTAIVLENTLGGTIVWSRTGVGEYLGTLTGAFTLNKTWCVTQYNGSSVDPKVGLKLFRESANTVRLISYDSLEVNKELNSEHGEHIEIRIYE